MKKKMSIIISIVLALVMALPVTSLAITSIPVKSISLNKASVTLEAGKTVTLVAVVLPSNATKKAVAWSSSSNSIASVSSKGVVTALKPGKATIIVKSSYAKVEAKCTVTVIQAKIVTEKIIDLSVWSNNIGAGIDKGSPMYNLYLKTLGVGVIQPYVEWNGGTGLS